MFTKTLIKMKNTFIEGIETDHFDFEVSIKSHLSVNVFTKSSFSSSRTTCYTYNNSLDRLLNDAIFSNFK